jgi:hypothetical protein
MKRALAAGAVILALVAAIVIVRCRGGESSSSSPSTTGTTGSSAASTTSSSKSHVVDPRTLQRGSIAGTVRDDANAPIAGARVCASPWSPALSPQNLGELPCTTTDAQGAYALSQLLAAQYRVTASAKTFRPARYAVPGGQPLPLSLAAGEAKTGIDLVLRRGGVEIKGTVSDITGGPIANALVRSRRSWNEPLSPPAETDATGAFVLWVDPGDVVVEASAEGYASARDRGTAPGTFDLLLTPESSLAGTVVDALTGQPVAGVSVEADGEWSGAGDTDPRDITDDKGGFRIARLVPGRYVATARSASGYGASAGSTLVGLGQHVDGVVVKLHPAVRVTARVLLPDGTSCKVAEANLNEADLDRWLEMRREPDGSLVADGVLPGTYQVRASCDGYMARDKYEPVIVADKDVLDVKWQVDAGATIRGRVVNKRGEPVAEADVFARRTAKKDGKDGKAPRGYADDESKADGTFTLSGLPAGSYSLNVSSERGVAPTEGWPIEVAAGVTIDKELVLDDAGSIAGTVVDSQGAAVAGVEVVARDNTSQRGSPGSRSRPDGTFVIENVIPGSYRVVAYQGRYAELRKPGASENDKLGEPVTVVAGKQASVKLVVEAQNGTIKGSVVDVSGAPATDAYVTAARENESAGGSGQSVRQSRWGGDKPVVTSVDGTFTLAKLAPGNYTVRAFRRGGGEAFVEHIPVGGTAKLQITATGSITGMVTAPGGGLDEFEIVLRDSKTGFNRSEQMFRTQGAFELRDLPAGSFVLTIDSARGKKQMTIELAAGEQKTGLAITLDAMVSLTGRVIDVVTKAPVPGMLVIASVGNQGGGGSWSWDPDEKNVSGDDGRFTLAKAPSGTITVRCMPRNFRDSEYSSSSALRNVTGSGTIDIGELEVLKRRVKRGDKIGESGIKFAPDPPGIAIDARSLKVSYIDPQGPAAKTELKVGDVVSTIDGVDVTGVSQDLSRTLLAAPPGTKITLGLSRGASVAIVLAAP